MSQREPPGVDRLLLVDDNPTNLQVLFQALEAEGYELLIAQSGTEALQTAREARPRLILLDINMPGMDGYETCKRLKADPETAEAVIIFLSARGAVADKVRGLELGAVDYIGKPFQFEEVVARVGKHLQADHQRRTLQQQNRELQEQVSGGFRHYSAEELAGLIDQGEGDRVEFKSTLRWNLHANKPDKRIENACLKTVAAYLNTDGGLLFVGVADDGEALGVQQDRFQNHDKLLLHWHSLIKSHLGVEFTSYVRSTIQPIRGQDILVVQCLPATQPVFLRRDNEEDFCVRTGNGSQPLKPSEVLAYLQQRHASSTVSPLPAALKGRRLGQYDIEEKVGVGAMGVVYRARHAMLRRPAAIKLLDESKTTNHTLARFEREVQLCSQLYHPNTIAIYDYGRTPEGSFYYVMEYLNGINLEQLVQQEGPLPEARTIQILRQVCGSLAEAHEANLIHRDIKPANIMLNYRGGLYDFVKLLDFGLVKATDTEQEFNLTKPGTVAGTPLYLSPEAIQRPEETDPRSDLYSLAAVGYYLLAGRPVFEGRSVLDICMGHAKRTPVPPSEKRGQPISEDLEDLILRGLEKRPEDRFQTAKAFRKALGECRTVDTWTEEQAALWWGKPHDQSGPTTGEVLARTSDAAPPRAKP
jgi:CheY-like chemotaxis protein